MDLNKLFQHANPFGSCTDLKVSFDDNEKLIIDQIRKHDAVLGCTPWLTNIKIIEELIKLEHGACIVTDKNAMKKYKKNYIKKLNKIKILDFEISDLPDTNFYFNQLIKYEKNTSSVRVFGKPGINNSIIPYLHYKFLIFCSIDKAEKITIEPKLVLAGSFNISNNATNSREMILSISNKYIVRCFFYEWAKAFILSENINSFSQEDINPEFLTANTADEIMEKINAENIWLEGHEIESAGLSKLYNGAD